jgi:HK97 gp10 family phage protein
VSELTFTGMDELLSRLEQLGEQSESVKKKALEEGAEVIRAEIESNTRRGKDNDHMADHIVTIIEEEKAVIGPESKYFYSHFLEFGTKKMAAKPVMGPAYESKKEAAKDKMAEVIREELGL